MKRTQIQLVALAGAITMVAGLAAQGPAQAPQDDLQRGVARISVMDGQVSVRRGDAGEWVAGVINAPLMADDSVATAPNSRAEVQFDSADILRIGGNAEVHLTTLENNRYQMELARGTVTFRVLRASNANAEVDTPSISVRPSKIGAYRISVNDAGETELTVRVGDVEVFTPKGSQWISAGQTMRARGNSADPEFQVTAAIPGDEWDRWSDSRDQMMMQASAAYQNVPPGVYGVEDMQNNGVWTEVPNYGNVWRPNVGAGWAPYSCGRWVWEDWYGWTWVGCESWGWAPYHYGRWFYEAGYGGWLWYPGVLGVRHYWSPALVSFFGWGGGGGFGFGFGNVGWVALAPYELFHPWWGRGFYGAGFAGRINISNVNVYNSFRNARVLNGVSGVTAGNFRGGQFGGGNILHASGEQLRSAGQVRGQMPFGPSGANLHYSERGGAFTPRGGGPTNFFTHQQPAAVQHMAVTQGLRGAEQGGREAGSFNRGGGGAQAAAGRSGAPAAARTEQNGASGGGWRRFGEPAGGARNESGPRSESGQRNEGGGRQGGGMNPGQQNTRPAQSPNGSGWRGFGEPSGAGRAQGGGGGQGFNNAQRSNPSNNSRPEPMRIAPQVMHERQSAPSYNAPRSAPSYNAPRSAPSYNAPRSAPSYSAPRPSGGGGGSRPSGGGGHSGGGGGHRR